MCYLPYICIILHITYVSQVDRLTSVTLFEMAYSKWGAKQCSLCEDSRYSRTGVCIECDAGMCHTYFHVTWCVILSLRALSLYLLHSVKFVLQIK